MAYRSVQPPCEGGPTHSSHRRRRLQGKPDGLSSPLAEHAPTVGQAFDEDEPAPNQGISVHRPQDRPLGCLVLNVHPNIAIATDDVHVHRARPMANRVRHQLAREQEDNLQGLVRQIVQGLDDQPAGLGD